MTQTGEAPLPPTAPEPDQGPGEISGQLTIKGDPKEGVHGPYWRVVIAPNEETAPVYATLSERVWTRSGLPPIDADTTARVTARRNPAGRWNVIEIDAGPKALDAIPAMVTAVEHEPYEPREEAGLPAEKGETQGDCRASYRFRLECEGSAPFETKVPAWALNQHDICSLPVGHTLITDWSRESWGWKLTRINDASLRDFFGVEEAADSLPTASGHLEAAWRFDNKEKDLVVIFDTAIPDIVLRCRLSAETLRKAGIRELDTDDTVTARLSLREGRWRLAELLEPRPDLAAHGGKEILYAVDTRFAFQEENRFGELVNWLDIQDKYLGIGITNLRHDKLVDIDEGDLEFGAHIVCDLKRGKSGWYASRIHRISDHAMVSETAKQGP